jgi:hypothetical protein
MKFEACDVSTACEVCACSAAWGKLAQGNGSRAKLCNHASRAQTRTTTPHARRDAGSADTRDGSMQYGEPMTGATPQRAARVLPHANIGHKDGPCSR